MDKRLYEGMFIVQADGDGGSDSVLEDIQAEIKKHKGTICALQPMGKRTMAYPINKRKEGVYYLMSFEVDPSAIEKMRDKFRINDKILRELILKTDKIIDVVEVDKEPVAEQKVDKVDTPASEVVPEPEVAPAPEVVSEPEVIPEPEVVPEPEIVPEPEVIPEPKSEESSQEEDSKKE